MGSPHIDNVAPFNLSNSGNTSNKQLYSNIAKPRMTREHAITFNATDNCKLRDYIIGTGSIVGPSHIKSASRISKNRICVYFDSKKVADDFVRQPGGIQINGSFIAAEKLAVPSKKLILSNVYDELPDTLILEELKRNGLKPTSRIIDIPMGLKDMEGYSHIRSFRRIVYVNEIANVQIPHFIKLTYENLNYRIFVNDDEARCYICQETGHFSSKCPANVDEMEVGDNIENPNDIIDLSQSSLVATQQNQNVSSSLGLNLENKRTHSVISSISTNLSKEGDTPSQNTELSKDDSCKVKRVKTNKAPSHKPNILPVNDTIGTDTKTSPAGASQETPVVDKPLSGGSENVSINVLMGDLKDRINKKFAEKVYPLNYNNFALLLDMIKGKQQGEVMQIVGEFTSDHRGIVVMLRENYNELKNRSMKTRFTKLGKKILSFLKEDVNGFLSDSETLSDHLEN